MKSILTREEAIKLSSEFKTQGKRVVLAGGCFDILHLGHILFLEKAKQQGDILFVWVESDEKIKQLKGVNRPIHSQKDRATILSSIRFVDYVITLPFLAANQEYDKVVFDLKPAIIATTKPDKYLEHKQRQAEEIGAKVVEVMEYKPNNSTSRLIDIIQKDL